MPKNKYILVGAGAISEQLYLKFFDQKENIELHVLDKNEERLRELKNKYPQFVYTTEDFQNIVQRESFNAGFICVPNFLHAKFINHFTEAQIPVLVEKPVVINPDTFVDFPVGNSSPVFVAHLRRFFDSSLFLREIIEQSIFGLVQNVEISDGGIFNWNLQSDYLLNREKSGGGVFMDSGIHWVDFLFSVLGDLKITEYQDNNQGGLESECVAQFSFSTGVGSMRFSRIRNVSRFIKLELEKASLYFSLSEPDTIRIHMKAYPRFELNHRISDHLPTAFSRQMNAFFSRVHPEDKIIYPNILPGAAEALKSVKFITHCYESLA